MVKTLFTSLTLIAALVGASFTATAADTAPAAKTGKHKERMQERKENVKGRMENRKEKRAERKESRKENRAERKENRMDKKSMAKERMQEAKSRHPHSNP